MAVDDNSVDERFGELRKEQMTFSLVETKSFSHLYSLSSSCLHMSLRETGADDRGRGFEPVTLTPLYFQCQCCTCKEAGIFLRYQVLVSSAGLPATFMSGRTSFSPVLQLSLSQLCTQTMKTTDGGFWQDVWSIVLLELIYWNQNNLSYTKDWRVVTAFGGDFQFRWSHLEEF